VTQESVSLVIERMRDVDAKVRRGALTSLAESAPMRKLRASQCTDIVRAVLLETDEKNRDTVSACGRVSCDACACRRDWRCCESAGSRRSAAARCSRCCASWRSHETGALQVRCVV
jgi:hypothetical protein